MLAGTTTRLLPAIHILEPGGRVRRKINAISALIFAVLGTGLLVACGGKGGGGTLGSPGNLSIVVSDPATCSSSANGPYSHIYVSISDVKVSPNANAAPGDSSFVDVTPALTTSPKQVDLLGTPNQCFVATVAAGATLAPGTYQKMIVTLAKDGTAISGNQCGSFANCVMLASDTLSTPHDIQLGSENSIGIQIPASQIAGGTFTAVSGQAQTLNLSFDACDSIVSLGSNNFRLKPVLFAGEASGTPGSVSGQLVDSVTGLPVSNGRFTVALEQPDSRNVGRVVMATVADSKGNFTLCPVMAGTYDVVASGLRTDTGAAYAATATLNVQAGDNLGTVPMIAVPGSSNQPAPVLGLATSATASFQPTSADITISALQLATVSGAGSLNLTIPLPAAPASTVTVATQAGGTCPTSTDCALFGLQLPPANLNLGTFSASGTSYVQSSNIVDYTVEGTAFTPLSAGAADCSPNFETLNLANVLPSTLQDVRTSPLVFGSCQ
jgi:hypothetical protein